MNVTWQQIVGLFILAMPVACVARTVVYEEIFREPREWCQKKSKTCDGLIKRKFFYVFTCEYCFSHWVTLAVLLATGYRLLYDDWRGFVVAFFSLVLMANAYLNLYARLRVELQKEKVEIKTKERQIEREEGEDRARAEAPRPGERI